MYVDFNLVLDKLYFFSKVRFIMLCEDFAFLICELNSTDFYLFILYLGFIRTYFFNSFEIFYFKDYDWIGGFFSLFTDFIDFIDNLFTRFNYGFLLRVGVLHFVLFLLFSLHKLFSADCTFYN